MRLLARWGVTHRLAVLGMWVVVLAATFFVQSSTGTHYAVATKLSGTPSAAAANLLQKAAPSQSGDAEQIVFETKSGTVRTPAVQASIQAMLGQVAQLPAVSGVTSPY